MRLRGRELSSAERKRRQRSHEGAVDSVAKSPKLSNFAAGMTGKAMFSIFGAIFLLRPDTLDRGIVMELGQAYYFPFAESFDSSSVLLDICSCFGIMAVTAALQQAGVTQVGFLTRSADS